jgi:pyrimidine operon attenuation protein/uracil phosphoribosyltransferase
MEIPEAPFFMPEINVYICNAMHNTRLILDKDRFNLVLLRLCYELIENHDAFEQTVLVGLQPRGVLLARRIRTLLERLLQKQITYGELDITFYRDDLDRIKTRTPAQTIIPFDLTGKIVVLVDDVIYKGRTIRAALNAVLEYGRPQLIRLLVLVDRGHRDLPIHPDFIGKELPTASDEQVKVFLQDIDGYDAVELIRPITRPV